jgi:hypothetical protein
MAKAPLRTPTQVTVSSSATAYAETFLLLFGIAVAAFVASLFVTGRLPRTRTPGPPASVATE